MAVSYKKLFHLLIEKSMTNARLQQEAGFSANIITRLKRCGYISLESLESICRVLNCGMDDILEFMELTEHAQPIQELDVDQMLRTLDHIRVYENGVVMTVFLDGTEIELGQE